MKWPWSCKKQSNIIDSLSDLGEERAARLREKLTELMSVRAAKDNNAFWITGREFLEMYKEIGVTNLTYSFGTLFVNEVARNVLLHPFVAIRDEYSNVRFVRVHIPVSMVENGIFHV